MIKEYFKTLNKKETVEVKKLVNSIKDDMVIAYPSNIYLRDVFIIHLNNSIDYLHKFIETEKENYFISFTRSIQESIAFAEGTSKKFLEILGLNLEILIEELIKIEYYEIIKPFEELKNDVILMLKYYI